MSISISFLRCFPTKIFQPWSSTKKQHMANLILDAVTARALHWKLEAIEIPWRSCEALGCVGCNSMYRGEIIAFVTGIATVLPHSFARRQSWRWWWIGRRAWPIPPGIQHTFHNAMTVVKDRPIELLIPPCEMNLPLPHSSILKENWAKHLWKQGIFQRDLGSIQHWAWEIVSSWWFQPIWKILVKWSWIISPVRGENKKSLKPPPGFFSLAAHKHGFRWQTLIWEMVGW